MHTGNTDLVTETDRQCESLVLARLQAAFPDHKFIGEEGSSAQVGCPISVWIVPLGSFQAPVLTRGSLP